MVRARQERKMNYISATTTPPFRLGCNLLLRVINNEFVVSAAAVKLKGAAAAGAAMEGNEGKNCFCISPSQKFALT